MIALIKAVQLLRLPKIVQEIGGRGTAQADNKSDTPVAIDALLTAMGAAQRKLMQIALQNPVSQQRDDLLVAHLSEHKYHLDKYMGIVATSASVAPLLGLLGTVSGMINTFKMMTIFWFG